MPAAAKQQAIQDLDRWLRAGELRHYIARQVPLDDTAGAHEAQERPHVGNIVIEIAPA